MDLTHKLADIKKRLDDIERRKCVIESRQDGIEELALRTLTAMQLLSGHIETIKEICEVEAKMKTTFVCKEYEEKAIQTKGASGSDSSDSICLEDLFAPYSDESASEQTSGM